MNNTLKSIRTLAIACSALALATAGQAAITVNAITVNAITVNALTNNALTNNGLSPQATATASPDSAVGSYTPSMSWQIPTTRVGSH